MYQQPNAWYLITPSFGVPLNLLKNRFFKMVQYRGKHRSQYLGPSVEHNTSIFEHIPNSFCLFLSFGGKLIWIWSIAFLSLKMAQRFLIKLLLFIITQYLKEYYCINIKPTRPKSSDETSQCFAHICLSLVQR